MLKMPRFIQADKANHRVRGSEVAAVCGGVALVIATVLHAPEVAALAIGAIAAVVFAFAAGVWVEWRQRQANRVSAAHGGEPLHAIEKADVLATAWGSWPVAAVLLLAALLSAARE